MMCESRDLLIEIGTAELPPKSLQQLSEALSSGICRGLEQHQLRYQVATPFATPRRLAVVIKGVATLQADREIVRRGPDVTVSFNEEGQPTKAALGFARSCGVDVEDLGRLELKQGSWLQYRRIQSGQTTASLIPKILETALASLPIPKRMRWGDSDFEFVRPVYWLVMLLGEEVIEANILGVNSGRHTQGHRFHHPEQISIDNASHYAQLLEKQGHIIPGFATRREQVLVLVEEISDDKAVIDDALLDEVTGLVEWPVAIMGAFDEKFLKIPPEAIIAALKNHQKCFHVVNSEGQLLPRFVTVSNIESKQVDVVRAGNERVIRPRLSDAAFFWEQDCKKSLESRLESLKTVIFQKKLGSLYDKSMRVATLSGFIAKALGAEESQGIRAAHLSKCDLMSDMVGEFPELQGIMGEYYARHDQEDARIATALHEQYLPRFWGDTLPKTTLGQALSIADKLDTLISIFGIGQIPTGDKDPFGLRRAAISVLRIIIECKLPLNIHQLLERADTPKARTSTQVFDFMLERLRGYYQDQGFHLDSIEAVLVCRPTSPLDIDQRIRGVDAFRDLPDMISLASANKRIHNLLKKAKDTFPSEPNPSLFQHATETRLYQEMETVREYLIPLVKQGDYPSALKQLASLRQTVDQFFKDVMVMDKDQVQRVNRLAFLQKLRHLFLQVADISHLQLTDEQ